MDYTIDDLKNCANCSHIAYDDMKWITFCNKDNSEILSDEVCDEWVFNKDILKRQ